MPLNFPFDFKNPDYGAVFQHRMNVLADLRAHPAKFELLKDFYKDNPVQFVNDWGCTYDPRNVAKKLPGVVPFLLFPKQEDWINWAHNLWSTSKPGVTEKSRGMGVTWLSVALAVTLCIFNKDVTVGFGSRKKALVDSGGDPKSIFHKIRQFVSLLPVEFRGGCDVHNKAHSSSMRLMFPETGSTIAGESGDGLGRGGRTSVFFTDEAAHIERPEGVESSLSENTECRIDISTPFGTTNPFYDKVQKKEISVFTIHWRDDPRKDEAWYHEKVRAIGNPVVIAQEYDLDYSASVEGVVIPSAWVQSVVDAHIKLGIEVKGVRRSSLDVADEGRDANGFGSGRGILFDFLETWSGKNSDIYATTERAFRLCDQVGSDRLTYDADGLGAGVRGDARKINEQRGLNGVSVVNVTAFRGSGEVIDPLNDPFQLGRRVKPSEGTVRTNEDYLKNAKAQACWELRLRFALTHRAVTEGGDFDPDQIISISSQTPELVELLTEISQPTYSENLAGKLIVDKMPDGARSPNRFDSFMIWSARTKRKTGFLNVDI